MQLMVKFVGVHVMSSTVRKIFMQLFQNKLEQLSVEAAEACHKLFRLNKPNFSRKFDRMKYGMIY